MEAEWENISPQFWMIQTPYNVTQINYKLKEKY